jgi:hypothetical protein
MDFIETKLNMTSLSQKKGDIENDDNLKKINNRLKMIFIHISKLYNEINDDTKEWNENVREFIKYHDDIIESIDEPDIDEFDDIITEQGFNYFVGYMCADIDEDEFDGPNDLSVDEWTQLDDIILYYYKKE